MSYDRDAYKRRNVVERSFNTMKQWRSLATRYDKLTLTYWSAAVLQAVFIWSTALGDPPSSTRSTADPHEGHGASAVPGVGRASSRPVQAMPHATSHPPRDSPAPPPACVPGVVPAGAPPPAGLLCVREHPPPGAIRVQHPCAALSTVLAHQPILGFAGSTTRQGRSRCVLSSFVIGACAAATPRPSGSTPREARCP